MSSVRVINEPIEVVTEPDDDVPYPLGRPTAFYWPAQNRYYKIIGNARDPWAEARAWWRPEEMDVPLDAPGDSWF